MYLSFGLLCSVLLWIGVPTEVTSLRRTRPSEFQYDSWSAWGSCSRRCKQRRIRQCSVNAVCPTRFIREERRCSVENSACARPGLDRNEKPTQNTKNEQQKNSAANNLDEEFHYDSWSAWGSCSQRCKQRRIRQCSVNQVCPTRFIREERHCSVENSPCARPGLNRNEKPTQNTKNEQQKDSAANNSDEEFQYDSWSAWGSCSRRCKQRRTRQCSVNAVCPTRFIREERRCSIENSACARFGLDRDETPTQNTNNKQHRYHTSSSRRKSKKKHKTQNRIPSLSSVQETCGFKPDHLERSYRVVGGQEAQRFSWPWQVAITNHYEDQYCGGTLIAPQWVLTAAHCIRKRGRKRKILVRMREHDFGTLEGTEITQKPSKDFPHPEWNIRTISNDIGLVKLSRPVHLFTSLGFACLPVENETLAPGTLCSIVGWGKEKQSHVLGSNSLREATVPLVESSTCGDTLGYDIEDTQVCAGYTRGGTDTCGGDSGGPLLCSEPVNNTLRWFIYGVTSFGEECGRKGKFGIYTKVSRYVEWIKSVIDSN